jgi:multiple sugar transport system ATP-binding protein
MVPRLGKYVGQQLTLGIRPENLHVATGSDSTELSFDANVEVVEQLGSEILLDVKAGTDQIVASVDPTIRTKSREKLRLALNPDHLHFFDPQTEMAL